MNFINLTSHDIDYQQGETIETFEASGTVASVSSVSAISRGINGIPVVVQKFGEVEGLPEHVGENVYIVSGMVLAALKEVGCTRPDIIAPLTDRTAVRNGKGHIVAVRGFVGLV